MKKLGFIKGLILVMLMNSSLIFGYGGDKVEEEIRGRIGLMESKKWSNAYVGMMYMGTPRDYEFYVAIRVLFRSLANLKVEADLVLIASLDVPLHWIQTLEKEDGVKVVKVKNLENPYQTQSKFDRFKLTLNKLYAWSLVEYERVVMLDSDNLFLRKTDELFQCGQYCAVFINPCIFHTGLFVLQPSMEVFKDMLHELEIKRSNPDGADQGFLVSYFPDLLDKPLFHPLNGTKLDGTYRLPLGYQMDASYYYLKLAWRIPCGPNSVITFPSAPWMKPWYWWSWPVLPLGLSWHQQRLNTIGYNAEIPAILIQSLVYVLAMVATQLSRPNLLKLCHRPNKTFSYLQAGIKIAAMWSILASYIVPFFLIPRTVHPLIGWSLYFLSSSSLLTIAITTFQLPTLHVFTPSLSIFGSLLVMVFPWYSNGIVRALVLFGYAFCCSPIIWGSLGKVMASLQITLEKESFLPRLQGESTQLSTSNKLY